MSLFALPSAKLRPNTIVLMSVRNTEEQWVDTMMMAVARFVGSSPVEMDLSGLKFL
jgi:hypothetical protein